jgi:acyl-CoA synthetase (AMP-forming)/AMP-acid ligase II
VSTDEIMAFVAERVAPQKRIRMIEVIDKIPKSPSGKILRRILVERERAKCSAGTLPEVPARQSVSSRERV